MAGPAHAQCGNGSLAGGEACDDGNTSAGDGCSASCTGETGWTCSGAPSVCCFSATHSLMLVTGTASFVPTTAVVELTEVVAGQRGAAWFRLPIDLRHDFTFPSKIFFGASDALGADGLRIFLARPEGGLESPAASSLIGLSPYVAIQLDTWYNGPPEIASDHVRVYYQTSTDDLPTTVLPAACLVPGSCANVEDGAFHSVVVAWVASTKTLSISVDGQTAASGSFDGAVAAFGGDPSGIFLGISATTGTISNRHAVCLGAPSVPADTDRDGLRDTMDTDDDGDGLADVLELGGDFGGDANSNRIPDVLEVALGAECRDDSPPDGVCDRLPRIVDSDGDDLPNHLDTDSDGDGLLDLDEGSDDVDSDGFANAYDLDDDGDGYPTAVERAIGGDLDGDGLDEPYDVDDDGDGIPTELERHDVADRDGDGVPSAHDPDDDGDGIPTLDELPSTRDTDRDRTFDYLDPDDDGDGIATRTELEPPDFDGDGTPNYLDTDADGDGLADSLEGPSDANGDGSPDFLEVDERPSGPGLCVAAGDRIASTPLPGLLLVSVVLALLVRRRGRLRADAARGVAFMAMGVLVVGCADPDGAGAATPQAVRAPVFVGVSAGFGFTCALRADDSITCFGADSRAQTRAPVGDFVAVSSGYSNACGLARNGSITCWGEVADGRSTPPPGSFRAISMAVSHGCALRDDGTLACWGDDTDARATPAAGMAMTFRAVSSGDRHGCAIRSTGELSCWGFAGDGRTAPPLGAFIDLDAGAGHTCAIRTDHTIACWGLSDYYQARAPSGTFAAVSAGAKHTCALTTGGDVECWGDDHYGKTTPPSGTFVAIASGHHHTCGLRSTGELVCWGAAPADTDTTRFVAVSNPEARCGIDVAGDAICNSGTLVIEGPFTAIGDALAMCGLRTDGTIECWGYTPNGEDETPTGTFIDVAVGTTGACAVRSDQSLVCWGSAAGGLLAVPSGTFTRVDMHAGGACALRTNGGVACWGGLIGLTTATTGFVSLDVGDGHGCALDADGNPTCFGNDGFLQATVPGGVKFSQISAGGVYTCGVRLDDGMPMCWGATLAAGWWYTPVPTVIEPLHSVRVGGANVCALTKYSQRKICWGYNYAGGIDRQFAFTPAELPVTTIDAAIDQTVAVYGGRPPYTSFRVAPGSGGLPEGVLIDPITGRIVGRPREAGRFAFRIEATDADLATDGQDMELVVNATMIRVVAGSDQLAVVGSQFGHPLEVAVLGTDAEPLEGVVVEFEAPSSGASASLGATSATTDERGRASIVASANSGEGAYVVTARVGAATVTFALSNVLFLPTDGGVTGVAYEPPRAFCSTSPLPSSRTPLSVFVLVAIGLVARRVGRGRRAAASATFALVATFALAANAVHAQPLTPGATPADADRTAREAFDEGEAHFTSGRFYAAAQAFERAYELSPRYQLLYNIYLAWNAAQELEKAESALSRYIEATPEVDPPVLLARLDWLRAEIARRRERAEAWAAQERDLVQASERATNAERRAAEAERQASAPVPPRRIAAYALFAGGGALAGLFALSIPMANNAGDDAGRYCGAAVGLPPGVCEDAPALESIHANVGRWRVIGWTSGSVALASLGTGLVLVLTDDDEPTATPDVACSPDGCTAGLRLRF